MDADAVKSIVTGAGALIAVVSAIVAHRAKVQTRRDLFDGERNSLVLIMAENDARIQHVAFQEAFAREELSRIEPRLNSAQEMQEFAEWVGRIPVAAELGRGLRERMYTADTLDAMKYTELGLTSLRKIARGERVNLKLLEPASYDLIFSAIRAFVARYDK